MAAHRTKAANADESSIGFLDVLRIRTFAILYAAEIQSIVGDQLARVALSVLIFDRTGSAWATALTYGLTYLPAVLGGFVLARIGDHLPRGAVMIGCEVLRAVAFAAMAIPGVPLVAVGALLVVAVFVGPAFTAAEVSLLSVRLGTTEFRTASGLRMASSQIAQVAGFAVGGVLVAAVGARGGLAIDAATFLLSAVAVATAIAGIGFTEPGDRPAEPDDEPAQIAPRTSALGVMRLIMADPAAGTMFVLSLLAGFFVVPEGLAVPYVGQLGGTTTQAGLLLATIPLGGAVGVLLLIRLVPERRRFRVALVMACATGVPLIFTDVAAHLGAAGALWFVSGAAAAYQVEVGVSIVIGTPPEFRSRLISAWGSLLLTVQGLGPLLFGLVASATNPALAVTIAGAAGTAIAFAAVALGLRWLSGTEAAARRQPVVVD